MPPSPKGTNVGTSRAFDRYTTDRDDSSCYCLPLTESLGWVMFCSYVAPLQRLLKSPRKTPIYATVTFDADLYSDGLVNGTMHDGVGAAKTLGWRMLDRGGIVQSLHHAVRDVVYASARSDVEIQDIVDMVYVDNRHFTGIAYQAFNEVLLTMLADSVYGINGSAYSSFLNQNGEVFASNPIVGGAEAVVFAHSSPSFPSDPGATPNSNGSDAGSIYVTVANANAESDVAIDYGATASPAPSRLQRDSGSESNRAASALANDFGCIHSASRLVYGEWVGNLFDENGDALRYLPPPSCARVYSGNVDLATAQRQLAGKHILIIGDTATSLQARSLIYALHFAKWPPRYFTGNSTQDSLLCAHGHARSELYVADSTFVDAIGPRALRCDCYVSTAPTPMWYENLYYHNRELNIRVTFLSENGCFRREHRSRDDWELDRRSDASDSAELFCSYQSDTTFPCPGRSFNASALVDSVLKDVGKVDDVVVSVSTPDSATSEMAHEYVPGYYVTLHFLHGYRT